MPDTNPVAALVAPAISVGAWMASESWPHEPGLYLVYFRSRQYAEVPARLSVARVALSGNGGLMYATDGRFLYQSETEAVFAKLIVADVPDAEPVTR